jgi:hypothetical protein
VFLWLVGFGFLPAKGEEPQPLATAEGPPIPIELYVSGTDTERPAIRAAVDKVIERFPRLRLTDVDIDTAEGRAAREKMEKEHRIQSPGEATLCIGPYHLVNRADDKEIQTYFPYLAARIFNPTAGQGRLASDPLPFARSIFGEKARLEPRKLPELDGQRVFAVLDGDRPVGWVADLFRATRCPMCNDTQFFVALHLDRTIRSIQPVRSIERYGKDVDANEQGAFLKRIVGRKPTLDLQVDAVVGATRTCGAYRIVLQELWRELERAEGKAPESAPVKP